MRIDPDKYYTPYAEELRDFGTVQTFADRRHKGTGPAYIKAGSRVLYLGADILNWLEANRVTTDVEG